MVAVTGEFPMSGIYFFLLWDGLPKHVLKSILKQMVHILKLSSTKWDLNKFMFLKQSNSSFFFTWAEMLKYNIHLQKGSLLAVTQPVALLVITVEY